MSAQLLQFARNEDQIGISWGGRASTTLEPKRNRTELLRFVGILLTDAGAKSVDADSILNAITSEMGVDISATERLELLKALDTHPSFARRSDGLFDVR